MSASLPVRVPTVESLLPASFSLASRPVPRGTPCGLLRLPSSVPVGSFHPTRFCPCWAHWGRLATCGRLAIGLFGHELFFGFLLWLPDVEQAFGLPSRDPLVALLTPTGLQQQAARGPRNLMSGSSVPRMR